MQRKRIGTLVAISLATTFLLTGCNTAADNTTGNATKDTTENTTEDSTEDATEDTTTVSTAKSSYAEEIDKTQIMTFEISVDETNWQTMLDNAKDEKYISADVIINGTTIKNVGIRPKGNSSLSQIAMDDTTDRYSFKIKFDEYIKGQTWMGLDKIVINNMFSDSSYMKEYLSYDIMDYIGVEAPLYAFADISINGETWGLYLAVEDIDSGYLDRVFDGQGELYKPESDSMKMSALPGDRKQEETVNGKSNADPNAKNQETKQPDVTSDDTKNSADMQKGFAGGFMADSAKNGVSLEYSDDDVLSYSAIFDNAKTDADESDYQRVITALKNLSTGTDLETYVDVDSVLKYFAAQTVVVNLDSYISTMGHNYYLYENNGKISILPWDYNMSFGGFQTSNASDVVNLPIDTPVSGVSMEERPLIGKLLEVPEYLAQYNEYLQEIMDGYFSDGKFEQTVDTLDSLISDNVKNDPTAFYTYKEYQAAIAELKELGVLRAESIQGQLDGTIPSTTEGQEKDSSSLVDASSIDLTILGTQGNFSNFTMPEGIDMDTMQPAMEIIGDSKAEELTEEQTTKLHDLGLTDEQITQLLELTKQGPGNANPTK